MFLEKRLNLEEVVATKSYFNLQKQAGEESNNLRFILNYFRSSKTDTTKSKFDFSLELLSTRMSSNSGI